ncbi:MAG: hypothetical protein IJK89_06380 [Clostridia bacterium]|nr:hypothetical protein [Clostridia bacterium]
MKKLLSFFFALSLPLLSGCSFRRPPELSERLIIEAIGVDKTETGFAVTVQSLNDLAVGADEGTPEGGVTKCCTLYGTTVAEALASVSEETGLSPLYSQARLLVLGYETARDALPEALDFFLRGQNTRADIAVAVAARSAAEIAAADFGKDRVGADVLTDMLEAGEENGTAIGVPLYRFMDLLLSETDAAYCPLLAVKEETASDGEGAECIGTVLFDGTIIRTSLTKEETFPLRILTEQLNGATFAVLSDHVACTLRVTRKNTKIRVLKTPENARFCLQIDVKCDITDLSFRGDPEFLPLDPDLVRAVSDAASRLLTERISGTLGRCFYENGCDVCRFRQRLRLRYPTLYRALAAQGRLSPADLPCEIECRVSIRRTGKEVLREGDRQ